MNAWSSLFLMFFSSLCSLSALSSLCSLSSVPSFHWSTGTSVVAAFSTTVLTMVVLLFCEIRIFVVIGMVVAFTAILGVVFSLVTLNALLTTVGPTGTQGDVRFFCMSLYYRATGKDRELAEMRHHKGLDANLDTAEDKLEMKEFN